MMHEFTPGVDLSLKSMLEHKTGGEMPGAYASLHRSTTVII